MSAGDFSLTPHEVMRGIKVRDGKLRLRPSGLMLFGTVLDALLAAIVGTVAALHGGWSIAIVPVAVIVCADALMRTRLAVVATAGEVVVRNRWTRNRIAIPEIDVTRVESVEGLKYQPVWAFVGWLPLREWEIGVIRLSDGSEVQCRALISPPRTDGADRTPTQMKVESLTRWIAAQR
jgi:hypothetical protein